MTEAEDAVAIVRLRSDYCWASDEADAEAYAALFAVDGVLDLGEHGGVFRGRADIAARIGQILTPPDPLPATLHCLASPSIEVDGDTATGRWYVTVHHRPREGDPSPVRFVGRYFDEYVRTADGWRFRSARMDGYYFTGY